MNTKRCTVVKTLAAFASERGDHKMKLKGSCLCQAVSFSFEAQGESFGVCHCSMCRKWGGGPALAVHATGAINVSGEKHLSVYRSSNWAERGFCNQCGSNIFYRLQDQSFCAINLGTIQGHETFQFVSQVFIDNKPQSYTFSNETHTMTEKEVMAKFGG